MKISRTQLKQLIKEEITIALDEEEGSVAGIEGGTLEDLASMFGELAPEVDDLVAMLQDMDGDQKQLALKQLLSQLGIEDGLPDLGNIDGDQVSEMAGSARTGQLAAIAGRSPGKRDDENNPWAICTASVGREDKEKYEKCVKSVKRQNRK